jgi:hypothetical protein
MNARGRVKLPRHCIRQLVQAGTEPVDEGHSANVQGGLVQLRRPWAVGLQALRDDPQKIPQHYVENYPIALQKIAQSLWHGEHPLAHRQAGGKSDR